TKKPALRQKILVGFAIEVASVLGLLVVLRVFGLLRPFSIPTSGMAPAIAVGDCDLMENFTYNFRKPRRGDIVVFKTDGIPSLQNGVIYVKRMVGLPGDSLRISDGKLFVNDKHLALTNEAGDIRYVSLP